MMKKNDTNKMYMYETVLQTCTKYNEAWNAFPAFASNVEQFNGKVGQLWALANEQTQPFTNFAKEKSLVRTGLMDSYRVLREILRMYAMQEDNYELMLVAAPSKSKLLGGKEIECIAHCRTFANAIQSVLTELGTFNITQAKLDAFVALIEAFETAVASPRNAIVARRLLNERIAAKVREIDLHLRFSLDALASLFEESHPDFFDEYHFSRKIVHYAHKRGTHHIAPSTDADAAERDDGADFTPHT